MIQDHVPDGTFVKEVANLVHPVPRLQELGRGRHIILAGENHEIIGEPYLAEPKTIEVSTLSAVVTYMESADLGIKKSVVHVVSPSEVRVITPDVGEERQMFIHLRATAQAPRIQLGNYMPLDLFIIQLQTMFALTPDRHRVLEFVGGMTAGLAAELIDDGVSQTVTTKKGLTRAGVPVKFDNPVFLQPFRTFAEIDPRGSNFVLRLTQNGKGDDISANAALLEADGGAWRAETVRAIGDWLKERLPDTTILA